jgi:L-gulonate 3-dehydrogenase
MSKIGVIGAGLIGRAWAMVFARAGHDVALYDGVDAALPVAMATIKQRLADLNAAGLIDDPAGVLDRITPVHSVEDAAKDAIYIQENVPETVEHKRLMFATLDVLAPADAILASSTSTIPASAFTESLNRRERCLVAHPVNPPYLVPLVELVPAPWTSSDVVARARQLLEESGQVPIVVNHEIQGFILNRLQGALLAEAFRLVEDGYVSTDDLDKTLADGLGLRWSFMGPFETIDLNAPGGVRDYVARYGALYYDMQKAQADPRPWNGAVLDRIETARRQHLKHDELDARQAWRDRRLMALAAHKKKMTQKEGE